MSSRKRANGEAATIPELFRGLNERIRELSWAEKSEYDVVCECDDASCIRMLQMRPEEYHTLRSDPTHFAVLPGHERVGRDEVFLRADRFLIVRHATPLAVFDLGR